MDFLSAPAAQKKNRPARTCTCCHSPRVGRQIAERTYGLCTEEGLPNCTKVPRRKRSRRYRQARHGAAANEILAEDFVLGSAADGRSVRILAMVDIHTREGLST